VTPFIEKGFRAELFEIMDNEIPTIKVTIPENEFLELKEKSNFYSMPNNIYDTASLIQYFCLQELKVIEELRAVNFTQQFPGININEYLPELNVGEDGYVQLNETEIIEAHNLSKETLLNYDFTNFDINDLTYYCIGQNTKLNFTRTIIIYNQMEAAMMNMEQNHSKRATVLTDISTLTNTTLDNNEMFNEINNEEPIESSNNDITDEFKTKNASMTIEINKYVDR